MWGCDLTIVWAAMRFGKAMLVNLARYAFAVVVPNFRASSVFGFALLVNMIAQMWSGFLLSLYYIPDPSFVMTFREEYMNEI